MALQYTLNKGLRFVISVRAIGKQGYTNYTFYIIKLYVMYFICIVVGTSLNGTYRIFIERNNTKSGRVVCRHTDDLFSDSGAVS